MHDGAVRLPAGYLAADLELAYAATAHRAQGATVDTAHVVITTDGTREALYVAATRAIYRTDLYAVTDDDRVEIPSQRRLDGHQLLDEVCSRRADFRSAVEAIRGVQQQRPRVFRASTEGPRRGAVP